MTTDTQPVIQPSGFSHVRLTVRDIHRSKAFYQQLFGAAPQVDFSDQVDEPGVREDPKRLYGGCVFSVGDSLLGLRPVAAADDTFDSKRVGLDHVSLKLGSAEDLNAAAQTLSDLGIEHGDVTELDGMGIAILSIQDPDDINLELSAPVG